MSAFDRERSDVPTPDSAAPEGRPLDLLGLKGKPMNERVWPKTYAAIERAGYVNLESASSGDEGATGAVFRAREKASLRLVALKVILEPQRERSRQQLRREQKMLCADLLPSSSVRFYSCIESPDGSHQPVLVLEYIDGQKIHHYAKAHALGCRERLQLCLELFREVAALNARGVLHGDISPNNVLVERNWRLRFIDFGIARELKSVLRSENSVGGGGTEGFTREDVLKGERRPEAHDDVFSSAALAIYLLRGKWEDFRGIASTGAARAEAKRLANELRSVGAPASVVRVLISAVSAGSKGADAAAIAGVIERAFEAQRAAAQRRRMLLVASLLLLPLGWFGYQGWRLVRSERGAALERSIDELDAALHLRPNLSHPAVVAALNGRNAAQERFRAALRAEDIDTALQEGPAIEKQLRDALELSREIEVVEPLRASLGEVLAHTPWEREVSFISDRWTELSGRHQALGQALDRGQMRLAWTELREVQAELAALAAMNAHVMRANQARAEYRWLEHGVAERLRALPQFAACANRAVEGEKLLAAGLLNGPLGNGAIAEFAQAKKELECFLATEERDEETHVRLVADLRRAEERERRIVVLDAERQGLESLRDDLHRQLESARAERDTERAKGAELNDRLSIVLSERDGAVSATDGLKRELETAKSERDAAVRAAVSLRHELSEVEKGLRARTPSVRGADEGSTRSTKESEPSAKEAADVENGRGSSGSRPTAGDLLLERARQRKGEQTTRGGPTAEREAEAIRERHCQSDGLKQLLETFLGEDYSQPTPHGWDSSIEKKPTSWSALQSSGALFETEEGLNLMSLLLSRHYREHITDMHRAVKVAEHQFRNLTNSEKELVQRVQAELREYGTTLVALKMLSK